MSSRTTFNVDYISGLSWPPLNLVDLLCWRALHQPAKTAYIFLRDGESEEVRVTYGELDQQARAIAARLQRRIAPGERALLLYPPGLEYISAFFGCLYAGVIAVPAYPPRRNQSLLRLQAIIDDAQATVSLTNASILNRIEPFLSENQSLAALDWWIGEHPASGIEDEWQKPPLSRDTLAFFQYTSGSTATPRGVMLTHGNLLSNEYAIQNVFRQTENAVVVGWLPLYHDMGLIGNVLQPLLVDGQCILMSPSAFLQRPVRWLEAISRYRATTSGGPNFAYDLCVRKITAAQRATLDLSSWIVAFNGAEPIRAATLKKFAETFAPQGFRETAFHPCYGLAEATLLVSGLRDARTPVVKAFESHALKQHRVLETHDEDKTARSLVSCGRPIPGHQLIIVDPQTLTECPASQVGEIWVSGPSVADGYWNKPEETDHVFHAYLADSGDGPFLRTGDLGFLLDGEVFITGRRKSLIIIRGINHYPQDIELTVENCHPSLRPGCGAAFSVDVGREERLVVVQEIERGQSPEFNQIAETIRAAIALNHEIQVHAVVFIKSSSIPKTSSGKIQRHACRAAYLERRLEILAEWHEAISKDNELATQQALSEPPLAQTSTPAEIEYWLRVQVALKAAVAPEKIDIHRSIVRYGLDSLSAVELAHSIETHFGVAMPMSALLEDQTISVLAGVIHAMRQGVQDNKPPLPAVTLPVHPISRGQKALWFLHQMTPTNGTYNIFGAVRIVSPLDVAALRVAFEALIVRHSVLRTNFKTEDGKPVALVHEGASVDWQEEEAGTWDEQVLKARLLAEAHRPFDLEEGPLLRVNLFRRSERDHVLLLTAHHLIADLWSFAVIIEELGVLYSAAQRNHPTNLPALPWSYVDYVSWQEEMLLSTEGKRHWDYWSQKLAGELPLLDRLFDRPRPLVQTYDGDSHSFKIDAMVTRKLKVLAQDATLYMTLLAAFQLLLHRYTQQKDIIVGSPTSGRVTHKLAGLVGYFVNPVALRVKLEQTWAFTTLLNHVCQVVLEAFEHQDYPFALLVERLQPERDASHSPLFQVAFVLQKAQLSGVEGLTALLMGEGGKRLDLGELKMKSLPLKPRTSQFDLTLTMAEVGEELIASFQYNTALFDATTIRRLAGHLETLLQSIVDNPSLPISSLPLLTEVERHQLLTEWAILPGGNSLPEQCLHEQFEERVRENPERIALSFAGEEMSYGELNARANQVARLLRRRGIDKESRVGLCLERSLELVIGVLGILKAGAAYVPVDPRYPRERREFMLREVQAEVLLTDSRSLWTAELRPANGLAGEPEIICLDREEAALAEEERSNLKLAVSAEQLAYVIYTSGSTGEPKGVGIAHGNVSQLLAGTAAEFQFSAADVWTLFHSIAFDFSVWELWGALANGGRLVIVPYEVSRSAEQFHELLEQAGVSVLNQTPTAFGQLMEVDREKGETSLASLRVVIFGGEALALGSLREWVERHGDEQPQLVNMYGITETTVHVTYRRVRAVDVEEGSRSLLGRGIRGWEVYVLDEERELVPVGVAGEIYVGGAGLARGYLNRAELTAERFVPHPFSEEAGARLYRSGDVARWRASGELEYVGRADAQVKVRGYRIELGEVEAGLRSHEWVREAVVVVREEQAGDKRLVAYVVPDRKHSLLVSELRAFLSQSLPEYMIPAMFIFLDHLPLTVNGKLDRAALPTPEEAKAASAEDFCPPETEVERLLASIWEQVLVVDRVGIHDNFFELGGDSILSMQIVARANQAGLSLRPQEIFQHQTIAELAPLIKKMVVHQPETEPVAGIVPLTPIQHWFFDTPMFDPDHYNQTVTLEMKREVDVVLLQRGLAHLLERHDALRSRYQRTETGWQQICLEKEPYDTFKQVDLSMLNAQSQEHALRETTKEIQRSFNLAAGPLLRAVLVHLGPARPARLLLMIHHLAIDVVSWRVLLEDLDYAYTQLCRGEEIELGFKTGTFKQWAERLQQYSQSDALKSEANYWLERIPQVRLSVHKDKERGANTVASTRKVTVGLDAAETLILLQEIPAKYRARIEEVLLTALLLAYQQWSGERQLLIDLEGHGREESVAGMELSRTVGWFTTIFPVLLGVHRKAQPAETLKIVKDQLRSVPARGLGFGVLRYLCRDESAQQLSRRPRAELNFNYLGQIDQILKESSWCRVLKDSIGLTQDPREQRRYSIEITAKLADNCFTFDYYYSKNLHDRSTVTRFANEFVQALRQFITDHQPPESGSLIPSDFPLADLDHHNLRKLNSLLTKNVKQIQ